MLRQITLNLDPDDYDAVQRALAVRQRSRDDKGPILPDGDSNTAGAYLAEICRGWLEMLPLRHDEKAATWTTDAPTATGWYWHRDRPTAAAYMAYVRDGACVGSGWAVPAAKMGGQWQGPLVPPSPEPDEVSP